MKLKKSLGAAVAAVVLALTATACSASTPASAPASTPDASAPAKPVSIGVVGASQDQWTVFKTKAEAAGVAVELKNFTDYTTENPAVSNGSLDSNQFQHLLYLARYNKDNNATLVPIASTAIYPLSLFSNKYASVAEIPAGGEIAVPNDETNKSRSLHLLAEAGLLKLKDGTGVIAGEEDIDAAASKVTVAPMDAQQTVTALPSIAGAVVNNDFVQDAQLDPEKALYADDATSEAAQPFINVFVVRAEDATSQRMLDVAKLFSDADFQAALQKDAANSAVLVTKTPAELKAILDDITADLS